MTLFNNTNAIKKATDLAAATIIALSLLLSQSNPLVAKAAIAEDTIEPQTTPVVEVDSTPVRVAKRTITVVATAYSSDVGQTDSTPCIPAMWTFNLCDHYQENGIEDTIAANFLPLGTEVRFPDVYGDQVFIIRDRMNAKYNGKSRIDLWKKDRGTAVKFGVERMKMEVL